MSPTSPYVVGDEVGGRCMRDAQLITRNQGGMSMFFKKSCLKVGGKLKWFPRAITLTRNPVSTQELAKEIALMSTASPGDVHLVLRCLPTVMSRFMNDGRPVHIEGLGSFFFKLSCAGRGVDTPEEVSREQIKAIRVQFLPERQGTYGRKVIRPMVQDVRLISLDGEAEENREEKSGNEE